MGSVSNRKARGRGWEARWYTVDREGKRKQHSKTFTTKREADLYLKSVEGDVVHGEFIDPEKGKTPFAVVAELWYRTVAPNLKEKTKAGYRSILDYHLLPEFGARPVAGITAGDVRRFIAGIEAKPGTQRNILRVLSPVIDQAVLDGMVRTNPVKTLRATVKLPRPQANGDLPFLDAVQVAELAEEVGEEHRALIFTAAYTGLRAGELAALRVRHLDFLHSRLRVEESVSDVNGHLSIVKPKNGKTRTVSLPSEIVRLLEGQTTGKGRDDFVFGGTTPLRHGNFYGRHFRPAVRRLTSESTNADGRTEAPRWPANLSDLRFHDLRHTAASLLIANGEHPKAVADRLGHSDIGITMNRYGHLYEGHAKEIAERLDDTFRAALTRAAGQPARAAVTPLR